MIERLSFTCTRFTSSSMFGARKNGLPNRNVVAKPMAVSAGTVEGTAERGRLSREYVAWNSFSLLALTVLNRFKLRTLILEGPSMPFAEVPYVATSKVWLVFFEWSKLYDTDRLFVLLRFTSSLPSTAPFAISCVTGCPSSWLRLVRKNCRSASRWQSALPLMSASLPVIVGALTGQAVPIVVDRFGRSRFSWTPSTARKKNVLSRVTG